MSSAKQAAASAKSNALKISGAKQLQAEQEKLAREARFRYKSMMGAFGWANLRTGWFKPLTTNETRQSIARGEYIDTVT